MMKINNKKKKLFIVESSLNLIKEGCCFIFNASVFNRFIFNDFFSFGKYFHIKYMRLIFKKVRFFSGNLYFYFVKLDKFFYLLENYLQHLNFFNSNGFFIEYIVFVEKFDYVIDFFKQIIYLVLNLIYNLFNICIFFIRFIFFVFKRYLK